MNQMIIHNIDGDDLRLINKNKDLFLKKEKLKNISTAISIARFLANKNYLCILSLVSPYRFLREEFKRRF